MEFVMPSLEFCRTVARHIHMAFFFTIKVVSGLEANCELVLSFVLFPTVSNLWRLDHHWESYEILKSWWWNWVLHGEFPVIANSFGTTASRSFFYVSRVSSRNFPTWMLFREIHSSTFMLRLYLEERYISSYWIMKRRLEHWREIVGNDRIAGVYFSYSFIISRPS